MDSFCDESLTRDTTSPILPTCFLKLALLWAPALFFWIFAPLEMYVVQKRDKEIPWSALNIAKLVGALSLFVLSSVDTIYQVNRYSDTDIQPVEYYTPIVLLLTMVAVLSMMLFMGKKGIHTSGVSFLFWLLLSAGTGLNYYVVMQKAINTAFDYDKKYEYYQFTTSVLYFAHSVMQLALHCVADTIDTLSNVNERENPEERASFLSKLTFWWFNPMVLAGYRNPLTSGDLWKLSAPNKSDQLQNRFNSFWIPLVNCVRSHHRKLKASLSRRYSNKGTSSAAPDSPQKDISSLSILGPILKTFGWELFVSGIYKLAATLITFANPLLLDLLISFVSSNEPYWLGLCYAAGMFFAALLESIMTAQYEYRIYIIGMRIRSCTISVVYKKAITLSAAARKNFTVGEVVNLMSVDTQRIMDYVHLAFYLWTTPLQIGIAIYFLWQQLGIATLGGLAVMILMIPTNGLVSILIRNIQARLMKDKDRRTKLMNEILNGIKVLKLYAWEPSFVKKVRNIRDREVASLRTQAFLDAAFTFSFTSLPFLVSMASFATFVLIDPINVLDPNRAFVSLLLFNILRFPTAALPMVITYTVMFVVSLKRVNKYLQSDEVDADAVEHDELEKDPVIIENGTFSWTKEEDPTLTDLNFRVKEGSLVAVVGQVGSGKSSLLSALLGEMVKWSGRVNVKGSVAYVPQQAWIQNTTLRKNVLFTKSYEAHCYQKVLEACALVPDLEILPGGDLTEIGEKGINLSGGQKHRVSLARAVYNDADIYYLDDPLSAVDVHVGKHIFERVIGSRGLLKNKTRILATHRISVLPEVDTIVVLQNGRMRDVGSYRELLAKKGPFADFLVQYLEENAAENADFIQPDNLDLIQEIAATVGISPDLARQLSRRSESDSSGTDERRRAQSIPAPDSGGASRRRTKSQWDRPSNDSISEERAVTVDGDIEKRSKLTKIEGMEVGSVKASVYLDYMKSYGLWSCIFTLLSYTLITTCTLLSGLWLSAWSNDALDPVKVNDTDLRNLRLEVYGGLGAGEILFTLMSSLILNLSILRASKILHNGMLSHIIRAPMSFFDTTPLGRILNRFSKDIDTTDVTIRGNIRPLLNMTFRLLSTVIIISLGTPFVILACLPLVALYYFLQKFYIPTSRQLKRLESTTRSPIYSHFSETVSGASCIRAFRAEDPFLLHSNQLVDANHESYYTSLGATRWLSIRLEFLGYSIVFISALFAVLIRNTISPGIAGLTVSYALQITNVFNLLVRSTADIETNIVAVERCLEYTKTPTEADWEIPETKPEPSWPEEALIHFEEYSTGYRDGLDLVLKDITCSISPKERCGIVGRTGAGKSSLTLALFRIIEAVGGKIFIGGIDIAKLGLHDLRSKLTIIPQDPVLFTGSLRMNLDPFESYSDEALWLALEQAHLKDFVKSLEKSLQHDISEGGENLSVGQRQLVCLARALLRKTKILVLDEATAAVDVETDELIQSTIRSEFHNCTVLTIAHRLNTIIDYDKVIVLDRGEIKEMGRPDDLLKDERSAFYAMAKEAGLV